jgi:hypothetical protein
MHNIIQPIGAIIMLMTVGIALWDRDNGYLPVLFITSIAMLGFSLVSP